MADKSKSAKSSTRSPVAPAKPTKAPSHKAEAAHAHAPAGKHTNGANGHGLTPVPAVIHAHAHVHVAGAHVPTMSEVTRAALEAATADPTSPKNLRLNEKIRHLIRLSKEQGYITVQNINESLPEKVNNPEEIENVINILENLEIDILDAEEVESYKQRQEKSEEEQMRTSQLDILDDPVRMYLKQMGQVPLLTREQEVAISKRSTFFSASS